LINAFNRFNTKPQSTGGDGKHVKLRIYGDLGADALYTRSLKRLAANNPNITFYGRFSRAELGEILKGLDVLVVPSIWYENSPLTIHEAFLTSTPVITSNLGGMAELVRHGHDGLLFDPGSAKDLFRKMNMLVNNPELLGRLRKNIKAPKSIAANARELEDIYNKIISGSCVG
jgi:glycosyltransferase involved in cell wall biosynthesis